MQTCKVEKQTHESFILLASSKPYCTQPLIFVTNNTSLHKTQEILPVCYVKPYQFPLKKESRKLVKSMFSCFSRGCSLGWWLSQEPAFVVWLLLAGWLMEEYRFEKGMSEVRVFEAVIWLSLSTLACSSGNLTLCTWPCDFTLFRYYLFARWATLNISIRSQHNSNNETGPPLPLRTLNAQFRG